ncbi:MAG: hypothetical protein AAFZ15_15600 [Bacteroidota bacterium]
MLWTISQDEGSSFHEQNIIAMKVCQLIIVLLVAFVPFCANAQSAQLVSNDSIHTTSENPSDSLLPKDRIFRVPAISLGVPDPYRKGYLGIIGGGMILQSRTRITRHFFDPDGNASLAMGLGNPEKWFGLEVRMNIYGLSDALGAPGNFGESTFDLHFSRLLGNDVWLGAGGYNLTGWNLEPPNELASYYFVTTKGFQLNQRTNAFSQFYLTVGIGNGRFRADEDYSIADEAPWNVFGSAALQVLPEGNFVVEWNGFNMFSGFSVLPFKKWPLQVVIGVDDIFNEKRKLVVAGSMSVQLFNKQGRSALHRASLMGPPPPQTSRIY